MIFVFYGAALQLIIYCTSKSENQSCLCRAGYLNFLSSPTKKFKGMRESMRSLPLELAATHKLPVLILPYDRNYSILFGQTKVSD